MGKCWVQALTSLLQSRGWSILPNRPSISMIVYDELSQPAVDDNDQSLESTTFNLVF